MKQLTGNEIRQMFLDYFKENGHAIQPSASLVPQDDPTLLWINSGVATLKDYFDGTTVPKNPRIANAQKSIRTNDIENVGFTARHHTFFEMLGNFSIGDYFKKEAIQYAWDFLTNDKWLGLDEDKLYVTVHPEDDEAYDLWKTVIQLDETRIIRLEENFWDIGEGPSGPNTEIFYDRGEAYGNDPNDPELYPGGENERYLEIWNLVFSQFNHNPDDTYTPLPKKNIDTGMGLERITSVIQDTRTNFETDLFLPIIKEIEKSANTTYGKSEETDRAFKVVADHIRTVSFAIGDHALPSNEGRGYVLRRLIRRAVRFLKDIGIHKPFMYKLVGTVGEIMHDFYPEVKNEQKEIENIIKNEEERFHETLNDGLNILETIIAREKEAGNKVFPGEEAFKLYDTYGFPKELTEEYVLELGFTLDEVGFEKEMEKQRDRARKARGDAQSMQVQAEIFTKLDVESEFIGYDQKEASTTIAEVIKDEQFTSEVATGETAHIILQKTPFYAESGGQVSDDGWIYNDEFKARVKGVQKAPAGQHLHEIEVTEGILTKFSEVTAMIDETYRQKVIKNHTATHLLHQALKDVLGKHVNQAGSLVAPERLRFDFSHFSAVKEEELAEIERIVNEKIWEEISLVIEHKNIDEAKAMGAMALFGEKYGDIVRVVQISDYSIELCGGCHVANTSEIGLFKIIHESGIGAGTRRIEAVTSKAAFQFIEEQLDVLQQASKLLKVNENDVAHRVETVLSDMKELERTNDSLSKQLSNIEAKGLENEIEQIHGANVLLQKVNAKDMNQLREMIDEFKQTHKSIIVLLAIEVGGKVQLAAGVTKDLVDRGIHAGNLIKEAAAICGGGGGGRPDMAQAGGKDPEKITEALQKVNEQITNILAE